MRELADRLTKTIIKKEINLKTGGMKELVKNYIRWWFMPGLDLFTRRRVRLCRYWMQGTRRVLDAGSGNGWFSYLAYRTGASVVAINIAEDQVRKAIRFYNTWRKIPVEKLEFRILNLYDIDDLESNFDEIICYETLEHIKEDAKLCRIFWRLLKQRGVLHLCAPYAKHPRWRNEPLDLEENGFHVRSGYTLESYRSLLEPIGFQIKDVEGMGGPMLTQAWLFLESVKKHLGDVWSLPLALLLFPFAWLDSDVTKCPYVLYVRAVKPNPSSS